MAQTQQKGKYLDILLQWHVSGRGSRIGLVCLCVCLSPFSQLNCLAYRHKILYRNLDNVSGKFEGQGQRSRSPSWEMWFMAILLTYPDLDGQIWSPGMTWRHVTSMYVIIRRKDYDIPDAGDAWMLEHFHSVIGLRLWQFYSLNLIGMVKCETLANSVTWHHVTSMRDIIQRKDYDIPDTEDAWMLKVLIQW